MGKIKPNGNSIVVEFDISELIVFPAFVVASDGTIKKADYIGNIIGRAAWLRLQQKTPNHYRRLADALPMVVSSVEGTGLVKVTYTIMKENHGRPSNADSGGDQLPLLDPKSYRPRA